MEERQRRQREKKESCWAVNIGADKLPANRSGGKDGLRQIYEYTQVHNRKVSAEDPAVHVTDWPIVAINPHNPDIISFPGV